MRIIILAIATLFFISCNDTGNANQVLTQYKIDSLQKEVNNIRPGLGELMLSIQIHHAKLWFAGKKRNWELANFETDEIKEQVEKAMLIETDRPEIKSLPVINAPLDSVSDAILKKDTVRFISAYHLLTNACNNCHKAVNFDFNEIKIPDTVPFSNQVFENRNK
jgi:hypothetical protein